MLRQRPPWTEDPILRTQHFTNMYRILDPGTVFIVNALLEEESIPSIDKGFGVLIYRLMASNENSFQFLLDQFSDQIFTNWNRQGFEFGLKSYREQGNKPFGGAYMVNAYHMIGHSKDKIENVGAIFDPLAKDWQYLWDNQLTFYEDMESSHDLLTQIPGIGNFIAYQSLVDLSYPVDKEAKGILGFDPNQWASAGPGAKRGLKILLEPGSTLSELSAMTILRESQEDEFKRLDLSFPWLKRGAKRELLSLPDIQNTQCEFFKYWRSLQGGKRGRVFDESTRR